jgi:hypothetical protein
MEGSVCCYLDAVKAYYALTDGIMVRSTSERLDMDYTRSVTEPIIQVSLGERMRGWWNDYRHIDAEVSLCSLFCQA